MLELTVLGSSSAVPIYGRALSSQFLKINGHHFLIDCGEGTQFRLLEYKISHSKINTILISHLHGDHINGLPGLLNSMNLSGRKKGLDIYGPDGLKKYLDAVFEATDSYMGYDLRIHVVDDSKYSKICENNNLFVFAIPLDHRIATVGYKIVEKPHLRSINTEMISKYNLDYKQIVKAKEGEDIILEDGRHIVNKDLTHSAPKSLSYAYCSDTKYKPSIVKYIRNIDILYHEATYMNDLKNKANERFHSTTIEAALIAKEAEVGILIIGHFSARYKKLDALLDETKSVFGNSELAIDGKVYSVENKRYESK